MLLSYVNNWKQWLWSGIYHPSITLVFANTDARKIKEINPNQELNLKSMNPSIGKMKIAHQHKILIHLTNLQFAVGLTERKH